jgi:rhamnogalacturonyl hydrolase YesR
MADSWILNNREHEGSYWYGRATIYEGYEAAYSLYGNETLLEWYRSQIDDVVVAPDGSIVDFNQTYYSLDDYRIRNNILYWYERTDEEKYRLAADRIRAMLDRHPRTETGDSGTGSRIIRIRCGSMASLWRMCFMQSGQSSLMRGM